MPSTTWKKAYTYELPGGKVLEPGMEFKLYGERGKTYRFIAVVTNPDVPSTWIDCFGGASSHPKSRSVHPEKINPDSVKRPRKKKAE